MIKYLIDLWILTKGGILIFNKDSIDGNQDAQFLGDFIGALDGFTRKAFREKLRKFTTDKFEYKLIRKEILLFFGKFPSDIKEKKALQELHLIANEFLRRYPKEFIEKWNHNLNVFKEFNSFLKKNKDFILNKFESLWRVEENHQENECIWIKN